MPCYDKKLEAARDDFFDKQTGTRDVDCVITASKYFVMLRYFTIVLFINS